MENYIKNQAELKKRQDFKKSLTSYDRAAELTNKVSNKIKKGGKKRKIKVQDDVSSLSTVETTSVAEFGINNSDSTNCTNDTDRENITIDTGVEEDSGSEYVPSGSEIGMQHIINKKTIV